MIVSGLEFVAVVRSYVPCYYFILFVYIIYSDAFQENNITLMKCMGFACGHTCMGLPLLLYAYLVDANYTFFHM